MRLIFIFVWIIVFGGNSFAQDTFYVKKKQQKQIVNNARPVWTENNRDSIVSYTVEFQKPGSNVYVVLHEKGPYLRNPTPAYGPRGCARLIFTEIIAIDQNGVRYRQPDLVRYNGVTVLLRELK